MLNNRIMKEKPSDEEMKTRLKALQKKLAAQTLAGAARLVQQSGRHPGELKDAVCSPGGTTVQGVRALEERGFRVFSGPHQAMTLSFQGRGDCEELASALASRGIAVRAGLHCAPLAHESAGTLQRGTVRVSFGHDAAPWMTRALLGAAEEAERKFTIGKPLVDHSQK